MPRHACSAHTLTYTYTWCVRACTKARITASCLVSLVRTYACCCSLPWGTSFMYALPWVQRTITSMYTCASTPHPLRSTRRPGDAVYAIHPTADILPGQPRTRDALEHAQDIPNARITAQERRGRWTACSNVNSRTAVLVVKFFLEER